MSWPGLNGPLRGLLGPARLAARLVEVAGTVVTATSLLDDRVELLLQRLQRALGVTTAQHRLGEGLKGLAAVYLREGRA